MDGQNDRLLSDASSGGLDDGQADYRKRLLSSASSDYRSAPRALSVGGGGGGTPLSTWHKRRSAAAVMLGMCAFKIGVSAFAPPFAELLLQRACAPLGLPYPGNATDDRCMDSDAAAAVAAQHTATFNLATSIPQLITVSFFAVLADYRGRQLTLLLCFAGGFLQFLIVWLVPAGRFCLLGMCTEDSFYFIVGASSAVSFLGGWAVSLSTSFAVIADVTEGSSAAARGTLFGIMEAFNVGGQIFGPIASGWLATRIGLQESFVFSTGECDRSQADEALGVRGSSLPRAVLLTPSLLHQPAARCRSSASPSSSRRRLLRSRRVSAGRAPTRSARSACSSATASSSASRS